MTLLDATRAAASFHAASTGAAGCVRSIEKRKSERTLYIHAAARPARSGARPAQ